MPFKPRWIVLAGVIAAAVVPPAGAQNPSAVLRTQPLRYTGVAGAADSAAAAQSLRTTKLQFTGTFGHK
jgi:hypothetical protein